MTKLKLGVPKGSLETATIDLFAQAGWKISPALATTTPTWTTPELKCALVRAQEMAPYVANGTLDLGLTGSGLDPGDPGRGGGDLHPHLLQELGPAEPLGTGGATGLAGPVRCGPRRQEDRHRAGGFHQTLSRRTRDRRHGRVLLGRHRGQGGGGTGGCGGRDHRDRQHHPRPRSAHRRGPALHGHPPDRYLATASMGSGIVTEVVMTMMFLLIILGATDKRAPAGFAPIAIGLGLTLIHLISIPVTNTSVNPARSTGPALLEGGIALQQLWMFWVAPMIGAVIAAVVYKWFEKE